MCFKSNRLNVKVSIYNGVRDNIGTVTLLSTFLRSVKHRDEVLRIRTITDEEEQKKAKKKLPMATVSGYFHPTREISNLVQHTGFICIDIDQKDNPHLTDMEQVKQILASRPEVCYAAYSVRGNGLFAIIPLRYPEQHNLQFRQLLADYATLGISLDKACGDVCRVRFISYDPCPYINEQAECYEGLYHAPEFIPPPLPSQAYPPEEDTYTYSNNRMVMSTSEFDMVKVRRCCEKVVNYGIDMTDSYDDWRTIGCALTSLGEAGRVFFHQCSAQSGKYNREDTDSKFSELLRSTKRIGLGTFFYLCQQYGITYARDRQAI